MEKILYVSDLDGTLLRDSKSISPFSRRTLESLIADGMLFTYATARSYASASRVTDGFEPRLPLIIYNGTFIYDPKTKKRIPTDAFTPSDVSEIADILAENGISPLTYAFCRDEEKYFYVRDSINEGTKRFIAEHKGDKRESPVCKDELFSGEIFHMTCIDSRERLEAPYNALKDKHQCVLYKEQYSGDWWLEIHPKGATKANAIKMLSQMLGAQKTVCFGDAVNDISMFEAANEAYAVDNAEQRLKEIATAVIGSNEDDGVAKWLLKNAKINKGE